eukprot:1139488-Pelagomonas_calceolata.AAC.7
MRDVLSAWPEVRPLVALWHRRVAVCLGACGTTGMSLVMGDQHWAQAHLLGCSVVVPTKKGCILLATFTLCAYEPRCLREMIDASVMELHFLRCRAASCYLPLPSVHFSQDVSFCP